MELEITENNDNPLLNRQEVQIIIKHENDATPNRNQVIKNLSEKLKAKKELIIIDYLKNKYVYESTRVFAVNHVLKEYMICVKLNLNMYIYVYLPFIPKYDELCKYTYQ